jgi:hypothetical protein
VGLASTVLAEPDHLVVAATTLDAGVAWCEATFGVAPAPGGRHAFMGTHNRLLAIGSPRHPRTYLEIIAVDPEAPPPGRARWFGLDDPAVRHAIAEGPRLVHWVARTQPGIALEAACEALRAAGQDPGTPIAAERDTPRGLLRWRITVGEDPSRPAVPLLITWSESSAHPALSLPASGVSLERLVLGGQANALAAALGAERGQAEGPTLEATFAAPRGAVTLRGL